MEPCQREASTRGLCKGHAQQKRAGRPLKPLEGQVEACTYTACERPSHSAGLCKGHYAQKARGKELQPLKAITVIRVCTFPDCGRPHSANGLCDSHDYQRRKNQELRPIGSTFGKSKDPCAQPECTQLKWAKGLCRAHYTQQHRGQPLRPRRQDVEKKLCQVEGCEKPRHSRGYCSTHARRFEKYGDPLFNSREEHVRDDGWVLCRLCEKWKDPGDYPVQGISRRPGRRAGRLCRNCRSLQRHSITPERFENLLLMQDNSCAICRATLSRGPDTHIDHDHNCCPNANSCGRCIRGILCGNCNKALGLMRDDANILLSAAQYLANGGFRPNS
ncbi:endonuclease domain-containing protein [Nonomuraea jabiensis]|uniref:endonuclease domain-containing protein n=1 Tax=Nonomuraea jabiensis TaxID=882448 RepID=UPI003424B19C